MNNQIKALNQNLFDNATMAEEIKAKLQIEWNKVFNDMVQIRDAVSKLEQSNDYMGNEYGEICSWVNFDLSDFKDCKEFFQEYMRERNFIEVDFQNDTLIMSHGDDNLIIQDDTRRDNGVWQGGKLVIDESDYKTEDGEIDETKRNALIEAHMEKTGYFPGVYRIDYHGNVFPVNTKS